MFDKDKSKKTKKVVAASHKKEEEDHIHISDLDDGEFAFMEWLNSENKNLKIILYLKDNTLHYYIKVKLMMVLRSVLIVKMIVAHM